MHCKQSHDTRTKKKFHKKNMKNFANLNLT